MHVYVTGVCVTIPGFAECGDVCNGCTYVRVRASGELHVCESTVRQM